MADSEQIRILRQGVPVWNDWRKKNSPARVDLSESDWRGVDLRGAWLARAILDYSDLTGADLSGTDLSGADLSASNLTGAKLVRANLADARLAETNFFGADLSGANLCEARLKGGNLAGARLRAACLEQCDLSGANALRADLRAADLTWANLRETDLTHANLRGADLRWATFIKSELAGASFADAHLGETVFAATSLRQTKALHRCRHHGPSSLDHLTLTASGELPEIFLRGCGLTERFVAALPAIQSAGAKYRFCHIYHAVPDAAFARRLHDELAASGICCWRHASPKISDRLAGPAPRLEEVVLLCCSRAALMMNWLDDEIQKALMKEVRLGGKSKALLVIDLDGSLHSLALSDWKKQFLIQREGVIFNGWNTGEKNFRRPLRQLVGLLRG